MPLRSRGRTAARNTHGPIGPGTETFGGPRDPGDGGDGRTHGPIGPGTETFGGPPLSLIHI